MATGPTYAPYLEQHGAWVECQLEAGEQFVTIHKKDIDKAINDMGAQVYRGARIQVKMPLDSEEADRSKWAAMGKGMMTDKCNFAVAVSGRKITDIPWPPKLVVFSSKTGTAHYVKYRLGGEAVSTLHTSYNGCKGALSKCPPNCGVTLPSHRPSGGKRPATMAYEDRQAKAQKGIDAFAAALKGKLTCAHLEKGKCRRGSKCLLTHEGNYKTWAAIPCKVEKYESGWCKAAPHCVYYPCVHHQEAAATRGDGQGGSSSKVESVEPSHDNNHA